MVPHWACWRRDQLLAQYRRTDIGQVGAGTRLNIESGGTISNFNGYAGVYNLIRP
jgi:hypothetical protein